MASRVFCAAGLLACVACSFPEFHVEQSSATSPDGGSGGVVTSTCKDGVRDGDELGIDCGPSCNPCPVCGDGMKNGDETGVDCGGSCNACPSCEDLLQNGSESDVDCGGTCSKRCDPDQRCREGADCASLVCNVVCAASNCHDLVRNGRETDMDCGGDCAGCLLGSACNADGDCASSRCQNQVCVSAGCTDKVTNGKETDTDCGGPDCAPCATAAKCKQSTDCESQLCAAGRTCSAPTCTDSTQNQGESAPDCGGSNCAPCSVGRACTAPTDCESALCQSHTCVPMYPLGQPLSKGKWQLVTSEGATESGNDLVFDEDVATNWTSGDPQHSQMYVEVDLGEPQIFFKALLQVTQAPYDQDFPNTLDVLVSLDGNFGAPAQTNVMGAQWTWVDFQTAQVGRYVRFAITKPHPQAWSIGELNLYN